MPRYLQDFCRWVNYLPMLVSHSIVSACFCFKMSFIHFDRSSSTFSNFFSVILLVLYRKWCEAQLRLCVEICCSFYQFWSTARPFLTWARGSAVAFVRFGLGIEARQGLVFLHCLSFFGLFCWFSCHTNFF